MVSIVVGILVATVMAIIVTFIQEVYDPLPTSGPQTESVWSIAGRSLLMWPFFFVLACIPPLQPSRGFRNLRRALIAVWLVLGTTAVWLIGGTGVLASIGILIAATLIWFICDFFLLAAVSSS